MRAKELEVASKHKALEYKRGRKSCWPCLCLDMPLLLPQLQAADTLMRVHGSAALVSEDGEAALRGKEKS